MFVKGGTTVLAFVQDPDGYKIELIRATSSIHNVRLAQSRNPASYSGQF